MVCQATPRPRRGSRPCAPRLGRQRGGHRRGARRHD